MSVLVRREAYYSGITQEDKPKFRSSFILVLSFKKQFLHILVIFQFCKIVIESFV